MLIAIAIGGGFVGGLLADVALRAFRKRRTRRFMHKLVEAKAEREEAKIIPIKPDDAA